MRRAVLFLVLVLVSAGASCTEKRTPAAGPAPTPAPRYVVLSPALGVILRDLGVADRAVGRSGWDMVLPRDLPVCGDQQGIDYEKLVSVQPTDVLLQWGKRELPARLTALASERGWAVRNYEMLTLDDVRETTRTLDALTGAHRPELIERMDRAWSRRPGLERVGRVLLLESVNPPAALGPGSWHQQLLERLGGVPAVTEGGPYIVMDAEGVLKLAPDAIVIISARPPEAPHEALDAAALRTRLGTLGTLDIPAVKNGRLALIDDPLALTPSTAMIGLADELAGILSGWAGTGNTENTR